jgi:hypothetical protein
VQAASPAGRGCGCRALGTGGPVTAQNTCAAQCSKPDLTEVGKRPLLGKHFSKVWEWQDLTNGIKFEKNRHFGKLGLL